MINVKKSYLALLLAFAVLFSFASVLAPAATASPSPIAVLDDCAGDKIAPDHHTLPFSSTYVGNSNSGIFHYSDCRYVYRMSPNHKVYYDSRSEAINDGYRPCKICQP